MSIFYFIIALGLLIFVHELGHFLVAKRAGICVETFSLGFGPRLFGIKRGETDYRLSALPLGGYVKMLGDEPGDAAAADPRSFLAQRVWTRARVVLFGPVMNLLFACLAMPIVFMIGRAEPVFLQEPPTLIGVRDDSPAAAAGLQKGDRILSVGGNEVETWEELLNRVLLSPRTTLRFGILRDGATVERDVAVGELAEIRGGYVGIEPMLFLGNEAVIDGVRPKGPADAAGLQPGDRIESFAGEPVSDWLDLTSRVDANSGREATIVVSRDGQEVVLRVTPEYNEEYGRWLIGIAKDRRSGIPMPIRRLGPADAFVAGMKENLKLIDLTGDVLWRLVTLKLSYKVLGGPIIIAKASAAAAATGLSNFIYFLAFLSLQLAVLNLLPLPVLDGGHLLFMGIEALRRKPVSIRIRAVADQVGFVLLIGLMVLVTYNDLENVWGIREWVKKLF